MFRVEKVRYDSHESDPKQEVSNSMLQFLCFMGNSFLSFLPFSPVGFIFIRSFKFKIGLMTDEPSYFLTRVRFFNVKMFGDLNYSGQGLLHVPVEIIQLHCSRCFFLVPLLIITSEIINLL